MRLLAERNALCKRSKDLGSELMKARSSPAEDIAALDAKIRSAEAHAVDLAVAGEKRLNDYEKEFVKDMGELRILYECNVQSIGGLCSPMPQGEPSVTDYIHWLSVEVTSLSIVFAGMNENFISVAAKGTLVMARGYVNLAALQASVADSGADIEAMSILLHCKPPSLIAGQISCPWSEMCGEPDA
jgi:hypothetical protein